MKYLLIKGVTETKNDKSYVKNFCRGEDGKKHIITKKFDPYFYSTDTIRSQSIINIKRNCKKDIFGKDVHKITVKSPSDVPRLRKKVAMHYEADVNFPSRFRYDHHIKSCFTHDNDVIRACDNPGIEPHAACIDIETLDSVDAENADEPIVSIALKDDKKNKYIIFINTDKTIDIDVVKKFLDDHLSKYKGYDGIDFVIKSYSTEIMMEMKFKKFLTKVNPDILYGWNYVDFDHKYMKNRMGQLIDFTPYQEFDLMHAYKTLSENELRSDKLDDVAKQELKIGKLQSYKISDMLENDIERLVAYNLIDVYITAEINKKNEIIKFHQTLAELAGCSIESTKYNSNIVDSYLLHFIRGRVALPSKGMLTSTRIEVGGKVHEASTGMRNNVAVVDLSKAYPTTIRVNNLSPETKLGYACDICQYKYDCEHKTKEGCDDWETNRQCIKMPSGRCYSTEVIGLIPATFIELTEQRTIYQNLMKEELKKGNKDKEDKYFEMQRAVKYLMNSFYGVLGSIDRHGRGKFRLADGEIGSDVTESIRLLITWIEEKLEDVSELTKYVKEDEDDKWQHLLKLRKFIVPIYGDTDSVLFEVQEVTLDDDIIEILLYLAELLNRSFDDFARWLSGSEKNMYEVEFEKLYETFFQGGKKKRYAGLFAWKKGSWMTDRSFDERKDVRGYELRRSDSSIFTKRHQKKLFEIILTGSDKNEVSLALQDWKEKFMSGQFNIDMKIPKGISKKEYKNVPIQLRAASYSNMHLDKEFDPPTKVFYCYMKRINYKDAPKTDVIGLYIDDDPSDYGDIDLDVMFDKQFRKPFERILMPIFGEDCWDELVEGIHQSGLEEFF